MNPSRRHSLQRLAALSASAALAYPEASAMNFDTARIDTLVDAAFEYAFPLYEMARTRFNALDNPANPRRGQVNTAGHQRNLADHRSRAVTTPNNDTLYSSAWLDLSAGPVEVSVGRLGVGRYWSVALMDFFTNHPAILGSRSEGQGPVQAHLVGPDWRGARPSGRVIAMPGNDVWLLSRWLAEGPHDLEAARAMQDALRVTPSATPAALSRVVPRNSRDAENFLAVVNEALARNPAPVNEGADLARHAQVGLHGGSGPAWAALDEGLRGAWQRRIGPAHDALRSGLLRDGRLVQGWSQPSASLGNFGRDHALRASVALGGLAALPPEEAVYLSRQTDSHGQILDGAQAWRIRMPSGGVPCDAFWSLSVYERMPDGRLFFAENPIGRFAIGDRTRGIEVQADGSMDIWLQRAEPTDPQRRRNWLPAPAGPLHLTLRAYLPKSALRDGTAELPTVARAD